jgi:membrane protein
VWIAASALFALYVANFGSYDKTYGALGGVVVFLVWMWITNVAFLLGAELNAELERAREIEAGVPGAHEDIQLPLRREPKERQPAQG